MEKNNTWKKAIRLNPHPPQSHGNMGICYARLGKRQKAIEAFDKALEIDPDYRPAALNKAVVEKQEPGNPPNLRIEEINYYGNYMKNK